MIGAALAEADAETGAAPATWPATTGPADEAICTGFGSDREYQSPAPASVITNTAMRPASSPRDNESRRSLMPWSDAMAAAHATP